MLLLTNEAMPDFVKIGKTGNLEKRIKDLSNTSVPYPFECYYACEVKNADMAEKKIHDGFSDLRITREREFFRMHPQRIVSILEIFEIKNVTPKKETTENETDKKALDAEKTRRSNFRFSSVGIEKGSELHFIKDETIKATVIDDRQIEFRGKTTTTSLATQEIMLEMGYTNSNYQGPLYWVYDGEALTERRLRREKE